MISVEEALKLVLSDIEVLGLEKVDLISSLGRVIGEDINLDGVFSEEDLDGNGKLSSPVSLYTLVISQ